MENKEQIKNILLEFKNDLTKITELQNYNIEEIIDVALSNQLYDSLIQIFKPITINGETKIYYDAFSTGVLSKISGAYETQERMEEMVQVMYSYLTEEEKKDVNVLKKLKEEVFSQYYLIPKEVKESLKKSLYTIDWDVLSKMKIVNTKSREISGWGHPITEVKDVIFYSEPACLPTCIDLFNKNIKTTMNDTSGVSNDHGIGGVCKVWIDYATLSEENKTIVENLILSGNAERFMDGTIDTISIFVPSSGEKTVGEVSDNLHEVSSKFKQQDILYGRGTPEEMYQKYVVDVVGGNIDNDITIEELIQIINDNGLDAFYDEEENLIWNSYNLYKKHKEYVDSLSSGKSLH